MKPKQIFAVTRYNFRRWHKNPRIVITFCLAFVLCFLLSDKAVKFAKEYETTMQRAMLFYQSTAVYTYNFMLGKSHLQHLFGMHIILRLVICGI